MLAEQVYRKIFYMYEEASYLSSHSLSVCDPELLYWRSSSLDSLPVLSRQLSDHIRHVGYLTKGSLYITVLHALYTLSTLLSFNSDIKSLQISPQTIQTSRAQFKDLKYAKISQIGEELRDICLMQ